MKLYIYDLYTIFHICKIKILIDKKFKYLRFNLTKEVQDLCKETTELEEYVEKWKDISCSYLGRNKIIIMAMLPKVIHSFNAIPMKIPATLFS